MGMIQSLPRLTLLAISLVQGLALFALYRAFAVDAWPSQSPLWSYPLWTIAIAIPLLLLLSLYRGNERGVLAWTIVATAILGLLAVYTGSQAVPFGEFPLFGLTFAFAASITLACFKALMYMQQRAARQQLTYSVLFTNSWRNFLVVGLSAVFAFLLWLVLMLWAALFNVIGIEFFARLFMRDWFVVPVLTVAFGLAVTIFRDLTRVIDSITRLLHGLIKLLLPLIVAVAVIFLVVLPFVGFDALWSTGSGTSLLLGLLTVMLFFTNAVYQDGRETEPYSQFWHRLIYWGLCIMPVLSALALYGLGARIAQYGWTVERAWAVVIWALLTLFAVGYVVGVLRQRDAWTQSLARVNTVMGIVVLAVMLLTNSPLLDFRKISLASQLARVESGEIEIRDFDFWYASRFLARPGYLAIEEIRTEAADSDPELLALIERPARVAGLRRTPAELWEVIAYRPAPFEVPQPLREQIEELYVYRDESPVLIRVDLDDDGQFEYVLTRGGYGANLFYLSDGEWRLAGMQHSYEAGASPDFETGEIRIVAPRFKDIEIDGYRLSPAYID